MFFLEKLNFKIQKGLSVNFLRLPFTAADRQSRDEIAYISNSEGLGISRMYPTSINEIEDIRSSFEDQSYPAAKWLSDRLLTIPTHHLLSDSDKKKIISALSVSVGSHHAGPLCISRLGN